MSRTKKNESSVVFTNKELYDLLVNDVNEAFIVLFKNKDSLLDKNMQYFLTEEFIGFLSKHFLSIPYSDTESPEKTWRVQHELDKFICTLRRDSVYPYDSICIRIASYFLSYEELKQYYRVGFDNHKINEEGKEYLSYIDEDANALLLAAYTTAVSGFKMLGRSMLLDHFI